MATPPKPTLLLTSQQKAIVDKDYKKDLLEIAREVFNDLTINDRRDRRVKAVKEYIANCDFEVLWTGYTLRARAGFIGTI